MSTLVYPQLGTGALGQYPIRKRRTLRTVVNQAADGSTVRLSDPAAETTEWRLEYDGLTDSEMDALQTFFTAAEGTLNGFTFLDPAGNLLARSGDLVHAVWERAPMLTATAGIEDPGGGTKAWRITNSGGGSQALSQIIAAPAGYLYCFSLWARASQPGEITLSIGDARTTRDVTEKWSRVSCSATGDPAAESIAFGLELPAGACVEVFGLQAEAQSAASGYMPTTLGGVYQNARLGDDALTVTTSGPNRHSCIVIIHANHL